MNIPENSILGKLSLIEVFEHYDFPRIFSCRNQANQVYVAVSIFDDMTKCQWLYVAVSPRRYQSLLNSGMSLRTALTRPEDGLLFFVETYPDHRSEVSLMPPEQVSKEILPDPAYYLTSKTILEDTFEIDVSRLAKSTRRESFNYHIYPDDKLKHEIPARKIGAIFSTSQELIDALGQSALGVPTVRGAIPAEILAKTLVNVCHVFRGSFGVQFQASNYSDIFDKGLVSDALFEFTNLLQAGDSEENLSNKLHQLKGRVASKYRRLLKELNDIDSGLTLDWGTVGSELGGTFELTRDQVARAYAIVDRIDTEMAEEKIVHGRLIGYNSRTKRYELLSSDDKKSYSGKVSEEAVISVSHPAINDFYFATLRMLIETQSSSGDELIRWVMVGLSESNGRT